MVFGPAPEKRVNDCRVLLREKQKTELLKKISVVLESLGLKLRPYLNRIWFIFQLI